MSRFGSASATDSAHNRPGAQEVPQMCRIPVVCYAMTRWDPPTSAHRSKVRQRETAMTDPADARSGAAPDPPTLEVRHRDLGDGLSVVALDGEIDLATAPELKSTLTGLLAEGFGRFVLDLSGVRHMDSTGLGVV